MIARVPAFNEETVPYGYNYEDVKAAYPDACMIRLEGNDYVILDYEGAIEEGHAPEDIERNRLVL